MLAGAFVLSLRTGIALHTAGLLFAGLAVIHIKSHQGWYKGLKTAGCKGARKKAVLALSVVFAATVLSGAALLFVGQGHCHAGLLHYKTRYCRRTRYFPYSATAEDSAERRRDPRIR